MGCRAYKTPALSRRRKVAYHAGKKEPLVGLAAAAARHYFGAAWQMPWGCLAVIVIVVLAAVVLAVYNPVRRILMQPITATISEL